MNLIEIGNYIRERRNSLGLNQENLADMSEVSLRFLKDIENGKANPSIKQLGKICDILGLKIELKPGQTDKE